MKKLILLFIIILFVFKTGRAQTNVYQPFPQDSAIWLYIHSTSSGETWAYTKWLGDTIINSKTYTKVYQTGNDALGQNVNAATWGYCCAVRQDIPNEKIYQLASNGIEQDISVSQHLIIGDTMPFSYPPVIITSIDSTLIYTKYHKVYNSQDAFNVNYESYIVGVGMSSSTMGNDSYNSLTCFIVDNINNGDPSFCLLASINKFQNNQSSITLYPNPATNVLNVEVEMLNEPTELKLVDVNGKQVLTQTINDKTTIDVSNLNAGVYNINISSNAGVINKRLVIVK